MANLKNITELPVAESAEGLNLIVNDNGAAKQVAASAISKVKTVNGAQPDESGNVQIDTASSWNDLKDKPFYAEIEKIAIFKNQNTVSDDYTVIEIDPSHLAKLKVGDFIEIVYNDVSYLTVLNHPMEDGSSAIYEIGNPFLIGAAEQYDTGEPFYAVIVPEAIFPIFCAENAIVSAYLNVETVHKLDAKYLPEDLVIDYSTNTPSIVSGSVDAVLQKLAAHQKVHITIFRGKQEDDMEYFQYAVNGVSGYKDSEGYGRLFIHFMHFNYSHYFAEERIFVFSADGVHEDTIGGPSEAPS